MTLSQTTTLSESATMPANSDVQGRSSLSPAALQVPTPRTPSPPAYVLSWTPNVPWRSIPLPPASAFFGEFVNAHTRLLVAAGPLCPSSVLTR